MTCNPACRAMRETVTTQRVVNGERSYNWRGLDLPPNSSSRMNLAGSAGWCNCEEPMRIAVIKKGELPRDTQAKLQKAEENRTGLDAKKYCGAVKLKEDPLKYQNTIRDEWERAPR